MDFEKMMEHFEQHKAANYEKLLREEEERREAIRQRKAAIAGGEIDFMDYYLWDHKDKEPELLRQWVATAEQLIAVTEQALGRKVAGSESKAFCEMARLQPDPFLDELGRIWNEIARAGNVVHPDSMRQKKQADEAGIFDTQAYFLREHKKEHPLVLSNWSERSAILIATIERLVGRLLEEPENIAVCELAARDPESVQDLQRILDEIEMKR